MYHKEQYRDEDVKVDVVDFEEQKRTNSVTAKVSTDYGEVRVAYTFPKGQGWNEKLHGTKKYVLKLKDLALEEVMPSTDAVEEKNSFEEDLMSEKIQA